MRAPTTSSGGRLTHQPQPPSKGFFFQPTSLPGTPRTAAQQHTLYCELAQAREELDGLMAVQKQPQLY